MTKFNIATNGNKHVKPNTKVTEVNLSVFVYRLFHEDFSPIVRTNLDLDLGLDLF